MSRRIVLVLALVVPFVIGELATGQMPARRELLVAAAASLSGLAPVLTKSVQDETGITVRFNFAGSNTLARQIIEGARVDVFISADEVQMNIVEQAGRLVAGSRVDILSNQLVVIVPADSNATVASAADLARADIRRVAMGDPNAVPAGVYGRQWLEKMGVWSRVSSKVVPLPSSPSVVAAIREGRAAAGVVYVTDARTDVHVRVVYTVPLADTPLIVYPVAAIAGGRIDDARVLIKWLGSTTARRLFESAGLRVLASH